MSNVHSTHCCSKCGCKYLDDNCPVASGKEKQEYPCEDCESCVDQHKEKLIELVMEYENHFAERNQHESVLFGEWLSDLQDGRDWRRVVIDIIKRFEFSDEKLAFDFLNL